MWPVERRKSHAGSGPKQADGCPGGRYLCIGPPGSVYLILLETREGTCGRRGAELKYRIICLWDKGEMLVRRVDGVVGKFVGR